MPTVSRASPASASPASTLRRLAHAPSPARTRRRHSSQPRREPSASRAASGPSGWPAQARSGARLCGASAGRATCRRCPPGCPSAVRLAVAATCVPSARRRARPDGQAALQEQLLRLVDRHAARRRRSRPPSRSRAGARPRSARKRFRSVHGVGLQARPGGGWPAGQPTSGLSTRRPIFASMWSKTLNIPHIDRWIDERR